MAAQVGFADGVGGVGGGGSIKKGVSETDLLEEADERAFRSLDLDNRVWGETQTSPDFDNVVKTKYGSEFNENYFLEPFNEQGNEWRGPILWKGFTHIPQYLVPQYTRDSITGLLPEVGYAYMTVSNSLYLWKYEEASTEYGVEASVNEPDILPFTGLDQVIVAVGLVRPRRDVFYDNVKYLLVVATKVEVVLVAMYLDSTGQLQLMSTEFAMPTDNVDVAKDGIVGTANGRIFLASTNGSLTEMKYQNDEGVLQYLGLRRKVRKLDRAVTAYTWVVPQFLRHMGGDDPLVSAVVDDARHVLYTLSARNGGVVDLYDLGMDGTGMRRLSNTRSVFDNALDYCRNTGGARVPSEEAFKHHTKTGHKILSIQVIPPTEATKISLVATSNFGFRFYYHTESPYNYGSGGLGLFTDEGRKYRGAMVAGDKVFNRPMDLTLEHIRSPPPNKILKGLTDHTLVAGGGLAGGGAVAAAADGALAGWGGGVGGGGGGGSGGLDDNGTGHKPESSMTSAGSHMHFTSGLCSRGVFLMASEGNRDNVQVLSVSEDHLFRHRKNDATAGGLGALAFPGSPGAQDMQPKYFTGGMREVLSRVELAKPSPDILGGGGMMSPQGAAVPGGWGGAAMMMPGAPVGFGGGLMSPTGSQPGLGKVLALSESQKQNKLLLLAETSRLPADSRKPKPLDANGRLDVGDRYATLPEHWAEADKDSGRVLLSRGVPLGELVTQHIGSQRQFACLTQYGVHHLVKERPIDVLCRKLELAARVHDLEPVRSFFQHFGQKQACAMCYMLGCGLPHDLAAPLEEIKRVLTNDEFGGKPKVQAYQSTNANMVFQADSNETLSPKFEGLAITVSRLLRPVWFTPLVVLKGNWDHNPPTRNGEPRPSNRWGEQPKKKGASAPSVNKAAPLLLSHSEMEQLMAPMRNLISFVRTLWKKDEIVEALRDNGDFYASGPNDPKSPTQAAADAMAMGNNLPHAFFAGLNNAAVVNEKVAKAKHKEMRAFYGTYRLLVRSYQALMLLTRLEQVHRDYKIKVDWEKLNGMCLRDLVTDANAYKEVHKLLNKLVQPSGSKDACLNHDAAEELSEFLKRECGLYYEKGEQLYFDAKKLVSAAHSCTAEGERREASDRAIEALCRAARYWTMPGIVKDRQGNLHTACTDLQELGRPDGVVKLCLTCAANFALKSDQFSLALEPEERFSGMASPGNRLAQFGAGGSRDMESAAQWAAEGLGKAKGSHDENEIWEARMDCYDLVIETLASMKRPENLVGPNVNTATTAPGLSPFHEAANRQQALADEAVGQALVSPDPEFHDMLYTHLYHNDKERLVRVDSDFIKSWFDKEAMIAFERRDLDKQTEFYLLLHKHYHVFQKYEEAGRLMREKAEETTQPRPIGVRIDFLHKAKASAEAAAGGVAGAAVAAGFGREKVEELEVMLKQAKVQLRIYERLKDRPDFAPTAAAAAAAPDQFVFKQEELEQIDALGRMGLRSWSELYNNFAKEFMLWELCLIIMMHCNHNDVDEITFLWRSIIMRELPNARTPEGQALLMDMQGRWNVAGPQQGGVFEEGSWTQSLAQVLIIVGEEVFRSNSQYVFPVRLLCTELEKITGTLTNYEFAEPLWVTEALHRAGVPYDELFATYAVLVNMADQFAEQNQMQILMSFTKLIDDWVTHTKASGDAREVRIFGLRCSQEQIVTAMNALLRLHPNQPRLMQMVAKTKDELKKVEGKCKQLMWGM